MSWTVRATSYEACSCKMNCRCALGPTDPDQGWCSSTLAAVVEDGQSDGVDLSGAIFAASFQCPKDFVSGIDKARVYFDEDTPKAQRDALEAILHGERGGLWENARSLIGEWLPTRTVRITVEDGDTPSFSIGDHGGFTLDAIKTEDGRQTRVVDAPVAVAFGMAELKLFGASGSFHDPDLRPYESWGYGDGTTIEWSA
ncbi:DUF1326 domain-containing protein [Streptomyces sp. NPDC018693]|uniref:DUF1326 domain-containing protein n=1 Tax=unclassified Streptomyces TaxID=2593676 RepID=UPI0037A407B4